jgi:hypothetical protein
VLIAAVAFVGAGCGDDSGSPATTAAPKAKAITATPEQLRALAVKLQQPIYWIGAATDMAYQRTEMKDGRISVRYVPVSAATKIDGAFLTIGTYRLADAYAATKKAAGASGAVRLKAPSGAVAFSTKARPLNAWLAYAGSRYQIEVFDPTPGRARKLVTAGVVARVPGSPRETTRPAVVSAEQLATLATAKRPIYWAGQQPAARTYELRQTGEGGYLLRYLSKGAEIGVTAPRLTVGTYPFKGALAAVKRLGRVSGAKTIKLSGGGVAVLSPRFPKSVYVAYPGTDVEIEVFAPSLPRARQIVTSGQIVPVP